MHLLLFLAFFQFQSQEVPPFDVITTQSGLSNSIVYDIFQDREGYIWMATDNGLNRFDGYQFQVFYHNPEDSTSISSNIVRGIREDEHGRLWIGAGDGFNLFNRETETFTRFQPAARAGAHGLDMQQMSFDPEGRLWFNTLSSVGWFDTQRKEFHLMDSSYVAYSLAVSKSGRVWSLSMAGELDALRIAGEIKLKNHVTKVKRHQLHVGEYTGKLWLNQELHLPGVNMGLLPVLPGNAEPRELLETDSSVLWIGTDIGLYRYFWQTDELQKVNFKDRTSALTESIRGLYQDPAGGIWVGTLNGVFHFDPYQKSFEQINVQEGSNEVIMGMENTRYGYFVNLLGKGIYQSDDGEAFEALKPRGFNLARFSYVWDIEEVPASDYPVWFATNAGVYLYEPGSGKWKSLEFTLERSDRNLSFAIKKNNKGQVWVVSSYALHLVDARQGKILQRFSLAEWKMQSIIQDIAQIGGQLFLATESDGLFVLNTTSQRIQPVRDLLNEGEDLFGIPIWDLLVDDQFLWVGTKRGLYQIDTQSWKQRKIDLGLNQQNRVVFSIEQLPAGQLWMGTENGLASYDKNSGVVAMYDIDDGLGNTEFNRKSVLKTNDNRLWLGGVNGITAFNPTEIRKNPKVPPVYIKAVEVITPDTTFSIKAGEKLIRLPWNQNTVVLNYVGLNYTNPRQNQYQYKLEGYDPEWSTVASLTARYVQLPPGSYSFLVKAANNDGLWNPASASIKIQILPPFWQTWWFRFFIILIIMSVLWLAYRYRVRRLLEVERMRLRIAGDLHDEVGSGLSGIALTGDLLQRQVQKGNMKPELINRITANARNLASSLDAIVWLIDPKKETMGDFLTKTKLVAGELLGETNLEIEEEVSAPDRERYLSPEQKRNLFLLIKESMNNVARHAAPTKVQLRLISDNNNFRFELVDDGNGFDLKATTDRHGLKSMQHRANELKAELSITSSPNRGTKVELLMKLP